MESYLGLAVNKTLICEAGNLASALAREIPQAGPDSDPVWLSLEVGATLADIFWLKRATFDG
jgi:hypothetical protein